MRDLAFVASWIILLPVAFQGAQLGVLLWTWTSLLAPNDVLYGLGASLPYAKIAAGLTLGLMIAKRGDGIRLQCNTTVMLMIALALCGLVSQLGALSVDTADGWDLCEKFAKILLLGIVVTAVMQDRLRLHALLLVICLGIGFTGLGEGAKFLLSAGGHKVEGSSSTGDNNQIGVNVLLILPMLYYLYATGLTRILRLVCVAVGVMSVICIVATASRAAFLGLAVLAVVFVLGSRRKVLGLLVVGALAAMGSQLVSRAWVDRMNTIESAQDDESFMGRVSAWKVSTAVALDCPVFGGGFHAIQQADVWQAHLEAANQVSILGSVPVTTNRRAAHSIYFEVLGDLGFGGLTLFLALFGLAFRNAAIVKRLVRRRSRPDLAWAVSLAGALQASMLVYLIAGASLSAAYYDIDYLLVAMVSALRELVERTLREPAPLDRAVPVSTWDRAPAPPVLAGGASAGNIVN